jgi:hypothetical protein
MFQKTNWGPRCPDALGHDPDDPGLPIVILSTPETGPIFLLIDSGSEVSLISRKAMRFGVSLKPAHLKVKAVTGNYLPLSGRKKFQLFKGNAAIAQSDLLVTPQIFKGFDSILGNDWLRKNQGEVKYGHNAVFIRNFCLPFVHKRWGCHIKYETEPFCPVEGLCCQTACEKLRQRSGIAKVLKTKATAKCKMKPFAIVLSHDVLVPPRTGMNVLASKVKGKTPAVEPNSSFHRMQVLTTTFRLRLVVW